MAISMTESAARHVQRSLDGRGKGEGIRLGVRTTGCSGLAYVLEFVDEFAAEDQVFVHDRRPAASRSNRFCRIRVAAT